MYRCRKTYRERLDFNAIDVEGECNSLNDIKNIAAILRCMRLPLSQRFLKIGFGSPPVNQKRSFGRHPFWWFCGFPVPRIQDSDFGALLDNMDLSIVMAVRLRLFPRFIVRSQEQRSLGMKHKSTFVCKGCGMFATPPQY